MEGVLELDDNGVAGPGSNGGTRKLAIDIDHHILKAIGPPSSLIILSLSLIILSSFSLSHEDDSVPSFLLILVIGGAYLSSSSARRPRLSARGKLEKRERERERRERE